MKSAIYAGSLVHVRHEPRRHAFKYPVAYWLLDLDELPEIEQRLGLVSVNRRNVLELRDRDHFEGGLPLKEAVRRFAGDPEIDRVLCLTQLRVFGYVFNPVSFYYCFQPDGATLDTVLAEITNTPWRERHSYVLPVRDGVPYGDGWEWGFDKAFHVSPFLPMDCAYRWRFTVPDEALRVHMQVDREGRRAFDATLTLLRQPLDGRSLARVLWRYPLMTAQVMTGIHWQALRLWLKRTPVHDHPSLARETP